MKLTEKKLKQMIAEELKNLNELDPFGTDRGSTFPQSDSEKSAQKPPSEESEKTDSMSKLKKELIDLSRNIQNIKGLDTREITLISGVLGVVLSLASEGSAATILQRVYGVLQKQAK